MSCTEAGSRFSAGSNPMHGIESHDPAGLHMPNLLKPSPYLELYIERKKERERTNFKISCSFLPPFLSFHLPFFFLSSSPSSFVLRILFFFIRSACERTRAADTRRTRGAYNATETRYSLQEGLIGRENYER